MARSAEFFFFQAEDGIRDGHVTGVQTCALPILGQTVLGFRLSVAQILICLATGALIEFAVAFFKDSAIMWPASGLQIGRASCRERVLMSGEVRPLESNRSEA